jgi:DNA-binding transcriptional ArsR family regulator
MCLMLRGAPWQHAARDPARASAAWEYVPLSELDGADVQVAVAPNESALLHTLASLTEDASRDRSPRQWRGAIRARLRACDVETLRPLTDPRTRAWPSCLSSMPLDRLAEEQSDAVAVEVVAGAADGRLCAAAWDPVLRGPERWLRRYATAMRRAWAGFEPLWRRSQALMEREADRIAAAAARGGVRELVAALHPYGAVERGGWRVFERPRPLGLRIHHGRLTVRPLLAESVCLVESDGDARLHGFSYPLPNAWQAFDDRAPAPASLEGLLGPVRSAILRLLDAPTPAGRLAESLRLGPSGVTHHLRALEPAGLIARDRDGRHVLVRRTMRGTRLLALYE